MNQPFVQQIETIRDNARRKMEEGAVTNAYGMDREAVLKVLDEVLATEIVCMLRYKSHYYCAKGLRAEIVADEFLEHANEEQQHADMIAGRIAQLGGTPNLDPSTLAARSHAPFEPAEKLSDMIVEDLVAERIAIQTYSEIIRWLGNGDTTTRRIIEDILAKEEEHADDLASLLGRVDV